MAKTETYYCVVKVIGSRHYVTERYKSRRSAEGKREERRANGDNAHILRETQKISRGKVVKATYEMVKGEENEPREGLGDRGGDGPALTGVQEQSQEPGQAAGDALAE